MPYRIDITSPPHDVLDRLVHLGALDVEPASGGVAAIIPDGVNADSLAGLLGVDRVRVSPAVGRDEGSVWLLSPRPVRIGNRVMSLTDSNAFGTGHHPTTAMCVEAIEETITISVPERILDVGTGSGVLALAALMLGVPRATGLDIDSEALKVAAEHARLNNLSDRFELVLGGPDAVSASWPLVVANVLAAPLIEMAPVLVRRVASGGCLILSGIPSTAEGEVRRSYLRLGMRHIRSETRGGWTVVVLQASW
jgi:ribosomal protein L11 methylase PrmA